MVALLGAINIPFYEEMARRIHWWQYSGCRMISFTPWYIVLGEFGIALVMALLARTLRHGTWSEALIAGNRRRVFDLCLLRACVLDYGPTGHLKAACYQPAGVCLVQ